MLFNSYIFLFGFMPVALLGYFIVARRSNSLAIVFLAAMSLLFYGFWRPANLLILVPSILINYLFARLIILAGTSRSGKALLCIAVALNLLLLVYFKYLNLFVDTVNAVFGDTLTFAYVRLPLGISFFTFTQIAYLVDVYRGVAREYKLSYYGLFVSYFPHLIAGPILHHKDIIPQFRSIDKATFDLRHFGIGIAIFAAGLFKKCVIADRLSPYVADIFGRSDITQNLTAGDAWFGAIAYALQLYFDFSGYCDMAVGLSLLFNINIPLSFNSPYKAESIIDFWRRWNMTLSRFLRDYLYIPLGGNRRGQVRRYVNLIITMMLGGLWHGAAWTFLFWGALHAFYLIINHGWDALPKSGGLRFVKMLLDRGGAWLLTMLAVVVAWVPFRAGSFGKSLTILGAMAGFGNGSSGFESGLVPIGVLAALVIVVRFFPNTQELFFEPLTSFGFAILGRKPIVSWKPNAVWAVAIGLSWSIGLVMISATSRFLYFRF
jgi:alginate O-acetyltransferase complex protein AlgI